MAHFTGRSYNGGNRQKGEDKMSELLKMEHLVKYYGNKTSLTKALNDISLTVEQGEFTAIMGLRDQERRHFELHFYNRPPHRRKGLDRRSLHIGVEKGRTCRFPQKPPGIYFSGI